MSRRPTRIQARERLKQDGVLEALRRLIDDFTVEADGCDDAVLCASEGHDENRAHPLEFYDWLRLELYPPDARSKGDHLTDRGRTRVVEAQRRRWDRVRSLAATG